MHIKSRNSWNLNLAKLLGSKVQAISGKGGSLTLNPKPPRHLPYNPKTQALCRQPLRRRLHPIRDLVQVHSDGLGPEAGLGFCNRYRYRV